MYRPDSISLLASGDMRCALYLSYESPRDFPAMASDENIRSAYICVLLLLNLARPKRGMSLDGFWCYSGCELFRAPTESFIAPDADMVLVGVSD
jgi:hypothetical protein